MAYDLLEAWETLGLVNVNGFAGYGWTFSDAQNIVTGEQRSGTRCLRHDGLADAATYPLSAGDIKCAGLAFKYTTGLGAGTRENPICYYQFTSGNPIWIRLDGAGRIVIMDNATELAVGTTPLNISVYNFIEFWIDNTTGDVEVYLNNPGGGPPVVEVSATFTPRAGDINLFRLGWFNTVSKAYMPTQYYDDIYVDDAGTVYGDSAVLYNFPTSNGSPQDWTPSSGNAFERVDNVPVDAAQYIEATTAGDLSTFGFNGFTETIFQVHGVGLVANWLRTGATAETARLGVNISSTDYFDAAVTVPQTTAEWARPYWEDNPATASPWAAADIQTAFSASLERVT